MQRLPVRRHALEHTELFGVLPVGEGCRVPEGEPGEFPVPHHQRGIAEEIALGELLLAGEVHPGGKAGGERGAGGELRRAVAQS